MIAFRLDDLRQHSDVLRLGSGKSVTVKFAVGGFTSTAFQIVPLS